MAIVKTETKFNNDNDLIEYDDANYFYRIADILLEVNEKTIYVKYLKTLQYISEKIKDFCTEKIFNLYTEVSRDNKKSTILHEKIINEIKNLNSDFIFRLMVFEKHDFDSQRYQSNTVKELAKIYNIIDKYDFEYYQSKGFDEWMIISKKINIYLTVNIEYFWEENTKSKNPLRNLLSWFGGNDDSKSSVPLLMNDKYKEKNQSYSSLNDLAIEDETNYESEDNINFWFCNDNKKKVATAVVATGVVIGTATAIKNYS